MQANKIKPGVMYAANVEGEMVRFVPDEVVTRRMRNTGSPHDYKSTVIGKIKRDGPELSKSTYEIDPQAVLGPYEEQVALVEKEEAEKAAKEARHEQSRAEARALLELLYELMGVPVPDNLQPWTLPVRTAYGAHAVDITAAGVLPVLQALRKLMRKDGD